MRFRSPARVSKVAGDGQSAIVVVEVERGTNSNTPSTYRSERPEEPELIKSGAPLERDTSSDHRPDGRVAGAGALVRRSRPMGYEAAAFTSATIFFSTAGVHSVSAYDVGHNGPSSRFAASSNPSVA